MAKKYFIYAFFIFSIFSCLLFSENKSIINREGIIKTQKSLVLLNKKIELKDYPHAFNPSLAKTNLGLLMTFRYTPDPLMSEISYIGIVRLNEKTLEPISKPTIFNVRKDGHPIPSHTEDARIFSYRGKVYIIYNDSTHVSCFSNTHRRDLFIAEVDYINDDFVLLDPIKLYYPQIYSHVICQKNWVPFEWNDSLLFGYMVNPHEILYANLVTGKCATAYKTSFNSYWCYGMMRGGTPALLVDREYLAFFHSSVMMESNCSPGIARHHYFMGAYTFSNEPPFNITKITPSPIIGKGFYTNSDAEKRVVFPGGFVYIEPDLIFVAYGKDDREIWIAMIDKNRLQYFLEPVQ